MMGLLTATWGMLLEVLFFWQRVSHPMTNLRTKINFLCLEIRQLVDT